MSHNLFVIITTIMIILITTINNVCLFVYLFIYCTQYILSTITVYQCWTYLIIQTLNNKNSSLTRIDLRLIRPQCSTLYPWATSFKESAFMWPTQPLLIKMYPIFSLYSHVISQQTNRKESGRKLLFNDALNTFYLQLNGIRHMVRDHLVNVTDTTT